MKNACFPSLALTLAVNVQLAAAPVGWKHLSSAKGDIPVPGTSTEQTGAVVADFDKDGTNDFIISFRKVAPALVWYRARGPGWTRYVIEPTYLTVEAGGAVHDIDGDGDLDVMFGGDWQSSEVWWWENPHPYFSETPWKRRNIKNSGAKQHHDQAFGDLLGTGKPQLAFWNQGAKKIFLAEIPADPKKAETWPLAVIFSGEAGEAGHSAFSYPEGMSVYDIDADGKLDLLAGNVWLKHKQGKEFTATRIGTVGGLIFAGHFKPGKYPQVVIAPGDGVGPVRFYECTGNPQNADDWKGRDLIERKVVHGHTLQLADINGNGNLDIFVAEMTKWSRPDRPVDNPGATAWLLFGDGKGQFRTEVLVQGMGFHEGRVADLNGDGRPDILNKPYTWEAPRIDLWIQQ